MDSVSITDKVLEKKLDTYGNNNENFVAPAELTVTITLGEYRDLVGKVATRQAAIDKLERMGYYTFATTLTKADTAKPYINQVKVGNSTGIIRDTAAHDEIAELREMSERLKGKPYYMKIQCHNCGAPLVIESSNHLIKCKYCHAAYFSGTQLVNSCI